MEKERDLQEVAKKMNGLLLDVVAAGNVWLEEVGNPGLEETHAYEDLVQSILTYADEYRGFELIQRALED